MAVSPDPLARLQALTELEREPSPARRMLVIVNPYASTVSARLKNLVVYALRGRFDVRAVDTQSRDHATELCRQAADDGYDVVVAFGGDGTVNEAANGLIGSDTPLFSLPGGRTNVWCRILGIPADVVDATEHLLGLAHDWHPRRVDIGRVNDRHFLFSAGVGLDASVVERVDANPRLKQRFGEYYYAWTAARTVHRHYLLHPLQLEVTISDRTVTGVTVIVQNAEIYTYFGDRPVEIAQGAALDSGDLAGVVLTRSSPLEVPTVAWRALSRTRTVSDHRRVEALGRFAQALVRSADDRAMPLQVDGDYIGEVAQADFRVIPQGLLIVA